GPPASGGVSGTERQSQAASARPLLDTAAAACDAQAALGNDGKAHAGVTQQRGLFPASPAPGVDLDRVSPKADKVICCLNRPKRRQDGSPSHLTSASQVILPCQAPHGRVGREVCPLPMTSARRAPYTSKLYIADTS